MSSKMLACVLSLSLFFTGYLAQEVAVIIDQITNPSSLTNEVNIRAGRPLVINCDAEVVGLPSTQQRVSGLSIRRQLHGETEGKTIVNFDPYWSFGSIEELHLPEPPEEARLWVAEFTGAAASASQANRDLKVAWTLNDASCRDAGMYECVVQYVVGISPETYSGQQNLTARADIKNMRVTLTPDNFGYEYTEGDNLTMTCRLTGPPNLQLGWQIRRSSTGFPEAYIEGVVHTEPVANRDDCNSMRYESILSLQVDLDHDGDMFLCVATFGQDDPVSENATLSISAAVINPAGDGRSSAPSSGGTDVGLIVGVIIGVLALIIIVLLLVYFCWYRKRNEDNDKDAENTSNEKPDLHAPPPVFYSKPNKPPKDDRDNGTLGKDSDGGDTLGRKARYASYDSDKGDDYSSSGGRRGRMGSSSSRTGRDREERPSRDYDRDANDGYPDSQGPPRYERRKKPQQDTGDSQGPMTTTDVSRSEDEASDAPLTSRQRPRPKRRTSRPSSRSEDRDDSGRDYRRGDQDPEYDNSGRDYRNRDGQERDYRRRDRENQERDYRRGEVEPGLHYAQLDLPGAQDRGGRGGRRDDRQKEVPVEYAEIRV